MKLETVTFNGKEYPMIQTIGGAALWVREITQHYCVGSGYDIGFSKEEWKLPGSIGIDEAHTSPFNAMNLPCDNMDFIHSSHCLEHVKENWYNVLDYWLTKIKTGGIIFLYLPHKSQEYWLPENNRKHIHSFDGSEIETYLKSLGHKVIKSGVDLNNSFVVVCEKVELQVKVEGKLSLEQIGIEPQYNPFHYNNDVKDEYKTSRYKPHADLLNNLNFERKGEIQKYWNSVLSLIPLNMPIAEDYFNAISRTIFGSVIKLTSTQQGDKYIITSKEIIY